MEPTINQILQQAINNHQEGRLEEAEKLYLKILKIQPTHPDANNNMGVLLQGFGRFDEAEESFNKAIELKPDYVDAYNNRGVILNELNKLEEAEKSYRKAIELKEDYMEAYYNLGITLQNLDRLDEAEECYKKAIKLKPDYANCYYNLGNLYNTLEKYEEAEISYKKVIQFKPNHAGAHNNLGTIFQKLDRLEEAEKSYKKTIELATDYIDAYKNLAAISIELKKFKEAEKIYKKIIELKPDRDDAYNDLGVVFNKINKPEEAEKNFKKAIELKPNHIEAYYNLGITLQQLGRLDEAEVSCKKAIELKPDYAEAHNNLGNILKDNHRLEEAEVSLKRTIELKPNHEIAHFNLGMIFIMQRQHKNSIEHFKLSNFGMSKSFLLDSLYQLDQQSNFYNHLDYLINRGDNNALIGSLISRSNIKYKINKPNPFCNEPLNYILKTDLSKVCDFKNTFAKSIKDFLKQGNFSSRHQTLLTNGAQTNGNIFNQAGSVAKEMQDIVCSEIEKYRAHFKDSEEGFLKNWPKNYTIKGWIISMKNGGNLTSHMHENGWLSGSVYINVPPKVKVDSGNLVVGLDDQRQDSVKNTKSINVVTGSLCLFPSSLHHYTIPFEGEEERIVLAFDVLPD